MSMGPAKTTELLWLITARKDGLHKSQELTSRTWSITYTSCRKPSQLNDMEYASSSGSEDPDKCNSHHLYTHPFNGPFPGLPR